jgi:hypothetical protein
VISAQSEKACQSEELIEAFAALHLKTGLAPAYAVCVHGLSCSC